MKKFLFTVCMLFSCVMLSVAQGDSYKIEGRLDNSVNGKLLLVANTENGMIDIGEAVITNGAFEFTGRMPETTLVYLMPVKKNTILAAMMLENAVYTITMGTNELLVESSGEAQNIWKEFNDLDKYLTRCDQLKELSSQPELSAGICQTLKSVSL